MAGQAGPAAVPRAGTGPRPAGRTAVPVRPGPGLPAAPVRPGGVGLVGGRAGRGISRPAHSGPASTERARAGPALAAALTGRLAPAAGPWLGVDPDAIRASLHDGPGWGSVERDGPGLRAALPLGWLAHVWAPGFPVVDGHLIVDVLEVSWPQLRVLGLPAPGAEPSVLTIRPDGEHWSRTGAAG
jgi:hypothetical protein